MSDTGNFFLGLLMIAGYFYVKHKIRKAREEKIRENEERAFSNVRIQSQQLKEKEKAEKQKARQALLIEKANAKAEKERQKRLDIQVTDEELEEMLINLRLKYNTEDI